jgi:hypothetical protein
MVKKTICSMALLAALVLLFAGLAAAQAPGFTPTPTIREQFLVPPTPGVLKPEFGLLKLAPQGSPLQPSYCNPCLFYGGDFDYNPQNGLYSGNTASSATVYVPFRIPTKPKGDWVVSGMFDNIEYYPSSAVFGTNGNPCSSGLSNGPCATDAVWSISTGLVAGYPPPDAGGPGTIICSGTTIYPNDGDTELTFTGRIPLGFYGEYTTPVTISGCPTLEENTKGTIYWLTVLPEWSPSLSFELSYLSDAEPGLPPCSGIAPPEAFGPPEPCDHSFFYSPGFGFPNLAPTAGSSGVCGGFGCDIFSVGVEGTVVK